ncbi:Protein Hook like protein 3 [Myotis brandtii]|uniref:Protein Hook like protein 3 n=2 Tax=Myotis brandtii TaxID=109478 RepID=S7P218_MYOBR|nr:Protein Hook like protein 3 [Myotis brandtii]
MRCGDEKGSGVEAVIKGSEDKTHIGKVFGSQQWNSTSHWQRCGILMLNCQTSVEILTSSCKHVFDCDANMCAFSRLFKSWTNPRPVCVSRTAVPVPDKATVAARTEGRQPRWQQQCGVMGAAPSPALPGRFPQREASRTYPEGFRTIQTFNVDAPCQTVEDLTSGVVMAQVLQKIDPVYFDENWLNRIKSEVGDNWRLKISNLKKILKGILDYNHEILGQQINDFTLPDVNLIGEHSDAAELGRMLQLILGCAVNCEQKQEYIQAIMMMEESVQHVVMTAIQELKKTTEELNEALSAKEEIAQRCHELDMQLMSKESPVSAGNDAYVDLDRQLKKTTEELNEALSAKEEIAQRCHELDMQVAALQEEKSSLLAENQVLMERLNQSDSIEDPNSPAGRRHLQLQTQLEQLQEETFRLEAAKDDYRIRCEELEKEISELRQQNDELTTLADDAQSLKDEIDVLRHSSDKVSKLEGQVESYKKKLEDLGDLRRQVKLLEEKNTMYMQNTVSLEEELRKANAARSQLETYKRQVVELQNRLSEESKKADKLDFEYKRLKEKVDSLQKEKDRLRTERDSLKETIEELRCVQAQEGQLTTQGLMPLGSQESSDSLAAEIVTPEIREKLIRLQHENKILKLNQEGSDNEKIALLQSLLDDANLRKNELETENRLVNQRLLEVQSQVEELQKSLQDQGSKAEDSVLLKKKLEEHLEKLHEANNELQKKRAIIEDLEPRFNNSSLKIEELQEALRKKEEEMKQMEERYKKYLEKAKSVIRTLDPKQNQGAAPEIQALKNQLQERDRMFHSLEKEYEKTKSQREMEEKYIVSAWYNMGMTLHKKAAEDRLASTGSGQSFLARQRQATSTRRSYPGHVQPATAR